MTLKATAPNHLGAYDFPGFRPFDYDDRALISEYAQEFEIMSCEYSFANLYAWQHLYGLTWCLYQDRLVVYDSASNHTLMPVGESLSPDALAEFSRKMQQAGKSGTIALVPSGYVERHPELQEYYRVEEDRDLAEYVYCARRLSELKGSKLHKKKNLISQFYRRYPNHSLNLMTGDYRRQALALAESILKSNREISLCIREEHSALKQAFQSFDAIGMEGLVLSVENRPVAFSMFSLLNSFTADIHFEKSDLSVKGAAQVINQATATYLLGRVSFINREQDLGLPGLRQSKLSYDPELLWAPSTLIPRNHA